MPVLEPTVGEDKLRQLLDEGTESPTLDFKEQLDLRTTRGKVELAVQVGAMLAAGGYIVVGADSNGTPTGQVAPADAPLYDEARLRGVLRKWISEPFEILSRAHDIDGNTMALIYIGPHPDGACIFRADGQYATDQGDTVTVFRKGDIYVRHGTSSERQSQEDVAAWRRRLVEQEKEKWLEELEPLLRRIRREARAGELVEATVGALDVRLDAETFDDVLLQLLRRNDNVAVRSFLLQSRTRAEEVLSADQDLDSFNRLTERVGCVGAVALAYDAVWAFEESVGCLVRLYETVDDTLALRSEKDAAAAWLRVGQIVEALGAVAVRQRNWSAVRTLTLQKPASRSFHEYWRVWLRHAITMAARAGLMESQHGEQKQSGLVAMAHAEAGATACFRLDVTTQGDRLLDSICQFDFLASVVGATTYGVDGRDFYPSFSRYYSQRVAAMAEALISDSEFRHHLLPGVDDGVLAGALLEIDRVAQGEGWRYSGWHGFPNVVDDWVRTHSP